MKTRLSAQPSIWKWFFILMEIKLIFTRNDSCAYTWPHFESEGFGNPEVAYYIEFWAQLFERRLALTRVSFSFHLFRVSNQRELNWFCFLSPHISEFKFRTYPGLSLPSFEQPGPGGYDKLYNSCNATTLSWILFIPSDFFFSHCCMCKKHDSTLFWNLFKISLSGKSKFQFWYSSQSLVPFCSLILTKFHANITA